VTGGDGSTRSSLSKVGTVVATAFGLKIASNAKVLAEAHTLAASKLNSKPLKDDAKDSVCVREFPQVIANLAALAKLVQITGMDGDKEFAVDIATFRDLAEKVGAIEAAETALEVIDGGHLSHDEVTKWFAEFGLKLNVDVKTVAAHLDVRAKVRQVCIDAQLSAAASENLGKRQRGDRKTAATVLAEIHRKYADLRGTVMDIVMRYDKLADLWIEVSGDSLEADADRVATLLAKRFPPLGAVASVRRAVEIVDESASVASTGHVRRAAWPQLLMTVVSLTQFVEVTGSSVTDRVAIPAFKRIAAKLGIQESEARLEAEFRKLANDTKAASMKAFNHWFVDRMCSTAEARLYELASAEFQRRVESERSDRARQSRSKAKEAAKEAAKKGSSDESRGAPDDAATESAKGASVKRLRSLPSSPPPRRRRRRRRRSHRWRRREIQ